MQTSLDAPRCSARSARSAVGASAPYRELVVDGVRLAYDDEGKGAPVVCLHAIGHGARDFEALRARLRGSRRVLALDWPGQGNSDADREPPSAERYATLLEAFLDALGIAEAALVGNSIGGAAAIRFAAAHAERVSALVLENPGGLDRLGPGHPLSRIFIGSLVRFFSAGARGARWFPTAFGLYYRNVLQRPAAAAQRQRIVASAFEIAPVLRDAWRSFGRPDADLRGLAPAVVSPVLFAWATRDRTVDLGRSLPAIERFPRARLERFAAGHAPHLETPEELGAAVERFLSALV